MKDKIKKTEKINNADGTVTYKYVYSELIFGQYQSKIETVDKAERPISTIYYKDNNYTNEISSCKIEYIYDNKYKMLSTYVTSPLEENFLSKIETGEINDGSFAPLEQIFYRDNNYSIQQKKISIKRNPDGTITNNIVFNEIVEGHYLSIIEEFDIQGRLLLSKCFADRLFNKLISLHKFEYLENNNYKLYVSFTEQFYNYEYLSRIEVGKLINNNFVSNENTYYKNADFTEPICKKTIYRMENGYITEKISREYVDNNGWFSMVEDYDNNNKYISGKYYQDKLFNILGLSKKREYKNDGSYVEYLIYENPTTEGLLSIIETFDKNNKYIQGKYYADKNFTIPKLV